MVTAVRIPPRRRPPGGAYLKLERKIGDYATVGVATHLRLGDDGKIAEGRHRAHQRRPKNLKATEAEALLVGNEPSAACSPRRRCGGRRGRPGLGRARARRVQASGREGLRRTRGLARPA
jgi:hypothetical protein